MRKLIRICFLGIILILSMSLASCKNSNQKATASLMSDETAETKTSESIKPKFYYKDSAEKRLVQLEQHIKENYAISNDKLFYQYNYVDLNEDFSNELLVWLSIKSKEDPMRIRHQLIILDEQFNAIFQSESITAPISVLVQKTNGWFDFAYFKGKGQYQIVKKDIKGNYYIQKSNENVIEFDKLEGVCYLSNAINEIGFQIK